MLSPAIKLKADELENATDSSVIREDSPADISSLDLWAVSTRMLCKVSLRSAAY